jgi:ribonuclease P protein component
MTASAKRIRTAVARNRIRRVVRESFRHIVPSLGGLDVVVIVRDGAREASKAELFASLARHWPRLARTAAAAGTSP